MLTLHGASQGPAGPCKQQASSRSCHWAVTKAVAAASSSGFKYVMGAPCNSFCSGHSLIPEGPGCWPLSADPRVGCEAWHMEHLDRDEQERDGDAGEGGGRSEVQADHDDHRKELCRPQDQEHLANSSGTRVEHGACC